MNYSWTDFLGIIGVALILITYLLLQLEKLHSTSLSYSLANGLGAGLIVLSLLFKFNLPAFIIEASWVVISILGILRYFRNRPEHKQ